MSVIARGPFGVLPKGDMECLNFGRPDILIDLKKLVKGYVAFWGIFVDKVGIVGKGRFMLISEVTLTEAKTSAIVGMERAFGRGLYTTQGGRSFLF